ncbi:transposase [Virgibacillus sp. W0430]|uniref:transposase n=1 Tax=Virgibacillus sp. W0430 TaxID=3391580 RepID=UPI003F471FCE
MPLHSAKIVELKNADNTIFHKNSFIYSYNNGRNEGLNNKIKVLNRFAYGCRSFLNYRIESCFIPSETL